LGKLIVPMFEAVRKALLQEKKQQLKTGFNTTIIDRYLIDTVEMKNFTTALH